MQVAITANGEGLNSQIDSRFGRTKYILLYNTETSELKAYANETNLNARQGAGIQTAQYVVELKASILITGNCGPKAFKVLDASDIKIYRCSSTTVQEAIDLYKNNELEVLKSYNVQGHWS